MWRWSASSTFFLGVAMSHLITRKRKKTYSSLWRKSKKKFMFEDQVISLWLSYIGERRITLSKAYGIKTWWYWAYLGEHNNKQFLCSSFLLVRFSLVFFVVVAMQKNATKENMVMMCMIINNLWTTCKFLQEWLAFVLIMASYVAYTMHCENFTTTITLLN
jgi:hypothetical protein